MKKIVFGILIAAFFVECHPRSNYSDIKSFNSDISSIRTWVNNYADAINSADIERILSYESDDIRYWPPNQPFFSGKDNLRKWFIAYFNYCTPVESYSLLDFNVFGDFAYLTGKYSISGKIKQSGEVFNDNGKFIDFFKRQADGKWMCTQSTWNSDNKTFDIHSQILDDFSGVWSLDTSKTNMSQDKTASNIEIEQHGNTLTILRTNEGKKQNQEKSSSTYTIGSETLYTEKSGIFTITSTFNSGRQTFKIKETLITDKSGRKQEFTRITTYTLTVKGEVLNVIIDEIIPEVTTLSKQNKHTELIYKKL
jgi:ketosteroid isomerase-like protein